MKLNYEKLLELNKEALTDKGDQLSAFFNIQMGVEHYLSDNITETHKNFLIQVGILELDEEDMAREKIVGPFNFSQNGPQED